MRRIEVLGVLIASIVAITSLWYTRESSRQVRDELGISQEGQITDRYTAAVENLGDGAMDVRLGGIYALQRIMEDSPRDHPSITNVLATYVRAHAPDLPEGKITKESEREPPADVQAALVVIATRDPARDGKYPLDLREANLLGVDLYPDREELDGSSAKVIKKPHHPAQLRAARLRWSVLAHADLYGAVLNNADLGQADLHGANLASADLREALLDGVKLVRADLSGSDVARASLVAADLSDAQLSGADLRGTNLGDADLKGARFTSGTVLNGAFLDGADLTGTRVEKVQLLKATITSDTRLPPALAKDPEIRARIDETDRMMAEFDKASHD